jgi:hypothetical protein
MNIVKDFYSNYCSRRVEGSKFFKSQYLAKIGGECQAEPRAANETMSTEPAEARQRHRHAPQVPRLK